MKYYYDHTVRYQEVDETKHLRWVALEECLLEVAGTVADDLGFGIARLHPMGLTWILTHMSVEMMEMPRPNDHIVVETWIEQNAHMLSTRDFRIYFAGNDIEGNTLPPDNRRLIGRCKSVWAILDLEKREIANIFDHEMFTDCVDGEVLEMARSSRMSALPEDAREQAYTIRYSDLDYNRHCNSCKYLQAMLDAYRPDGNTTRPMRLDIHYAREVHEGMQTTIRYAQDGDITRYQMLTEDGLTSCFAFLRSIETIES